MDTAAQTIPVIQQQIEQTENQIHLLLGEPPGTVPRGQSLTEQELPPDVPAGLTSALLERRPDIRAAEQDLDRRQRRDRRRQGGLLSAIELERISGRPKHPTCEPLQRAHSAWTLAPQLTQPIFTAGRLKSSVRLTEAQREEALVQYEKTIQTAFAEVSNSLIAHQRTRESRDKQEDLVYRFARPAAPGLYSVSRRRGHPTRRARRRSRSVFR